MKIATPPFFVLGGQVVAVVAGDGWELFLSDLELDENHGVRFVGLDELVQSRSSG